MADPAFLSLSEGEPGIRLGIFGRGKVACALARRWEDVHGSTALLWSRSQSNAGSVDQQRTRGFEVASLAAVLAPQLVYAAIPSRGLIALAGREPVLQRFGGTMLLAGIDAGIDDVRRALPEAIVTRAIPSLLEAPSEVSFLILDDARSRRIPRSYMAAWEGLGPIDFVQNESALELLMHLGGPLPVVFGQALDNAFSDALTARGLEPALRDVADRIFWRAMRAYGAVPFALRRTRDKDVVTKGGVTEAGLRRMGGLVTAISSLIDVFTDRVRELRK